MLELSAVARGIADEPHLRNAALRLQREACRLTHASEAMLMTYDWTARTAWSVDGMIDSIIVRDLVASVARSGRRTLRGNSLVEPIGTAPARAVLALRRPEGDPFVRDDVVLISALVGGIAAALNRLIGRP